MNGLPTPKSYLSPSDKERIERELSEIRARRRATSDVSDRGPEYYRPPEVDISDEQLARREAKLKSVLERESAPKLAGSQRNAAYKEFQHLVREWEENALTKQEQGYGYPEIMKKREGAEQDFDRAKKKCVAWEGGDRGNWVGNRLKELAGVIDPDNSDLRNLEHYRRRA